MIQVAVPANCWFGAKLISSNSYNLSSCTVAPGFDFLDFELADRRTLLQNYPHYADLIKTLSVELPDQ
jgi:predicted cupin superfamily sugar epimerase